MSNSIKFFLIGTLLLGATLRLYNLGGPDISGDDALYSFRAVDYIDYVASVNKQSTPITWFAEPEWWQKFSFHDAPPLVFLIQWIFFQIGGDNVWAAKLPFVLAGLLSIYFIFLLGKLLFNDWVGAAAGLALAFANYPVWISRIGFLDGFLVLWIILALYFFVKAREKPINYLWWGIFSALGILTKYTFLFTGPVFLIMLIIFQKEAWRKKWFYFGLVFILILLAPVIIYNVMMWKARGHLDAALSTLIGQMPDDFRGLTREVNLDLNIFSLAEKIGSNLSLGLQMLSLGGIALLAIKILKDKQNRRTYCLISAGLLMALMTLALIGGSDHFGVIILPWIALMIGNLAFWIWTNAKKWQLTALVIVAILVFGWELFFTIQSQLMPAPIVENKFFLDINRPSWSGYNQLEEYVKRFYQKNSYPNLIIFVQAPQLAQYQVDLINSLPEETSELPNQNHLLVFDDRMDWTPSVWIFERRRLYDIAPIPSLTQLIAAVNKNGIEHFTQYGFKEATFIMTTPITRTNTAVDHEILQKFAKDLESKAKPIEEIRRPDGETAFKIYNLPI